MEYYSAIKKNEIMPFAATWMDLKISILSEVNQRKTNSAYITYMWNLKYDTNLSMKQKQTHRHREQTGWEKDGLGVWH